MKGFHPGIEQELRILSPYKAGRTPVHWAHYVATFSKGETYGTRAVRKDSGIRYRDGDL